MLKRSVLLPLALASALVLAFAAAAAGGVGGNSDGPANRQTVDTTRALVVLTGEPLSTSVKTRPAPGRKIDFNNRDVRAYRAELSALRNEFKSWLRANAPAAKVTREFDIALNAVGVELNGTSLDTLRLAPMAISASYQGVYYPLGHDESDIDLALVNAVAAWRAGNSTAEAKGANVQVAVIDSGIDERHPCFSDGKPDNPNTFVNDKVIVAKVFNMQTPSRRHTPQDFNGHGTHVAGTIACNEHTPGAVVDGAPIPYDMSGVAPAAKLGNYNVFPGHVESVRWEDLVDALEEAYEDGMDVANMSIGGGYEGIADLGSMAVNNLDRAGMLSAVAAGNSGPGFNTVEAPGRAERALTAGAITVGHRVRMFVEVTGKDYDAVRGDFAKPTTDTVAPLAVVAGGSTATGGLHEACTALPAGSLNGKIALISRGTCFFSVKLRNVLAAGGVGAIVVNNQPGEPFTMGTDGLPNQPNIPGYMVGIADRDELKGKHGELAKLEAAGLYFRNADSDSWMATFSSHGPTEVDYRVKPDAVAPGVNVLSAQPLQLCGATATSCWAFYQGTSMATPHLAGAAAVVLSQHMSPTRWSPAEIRSAIVNTADENVVKSIDGKATVSDFLVRGAGRANVLSAVNAKVALDPVSVSFGAVPSGSGHSDTRTISLTNLTGAATGVTISPGSVDGVTYSAALNGNTITIRMSAAKGIANGGRPAVLRVWNGTTEIAHAAVYTFIK